MSRNRSVRGKNDLIQVENPERELSGASRSGRRLSALLMKRYRAVREAQSSFDRSPDEPESLHLVRTSVRKLRSVLKFLAPLVSPSDVRMKEFREELKLSYRALGETREWDVLRIQWDFLRRSLPDPWNEGEFPFKSSGDRQRFLSGHPVVLEKNIPFDEVIVSFEKGIRNPAHPIRPFVRKRLDRWNGRIVEHMNMWDSLDLAGRHRLRIDVKNLSEVFDIVGVLWPHRVDPGFRRLLRKARSLLGGIHDRDRAVVLLTPFLDSPKPNLCRAAGMLLGWYILRGRSSEEKFRKVRRRYMALRHPWHS
ncbi:MAG: CHAD domain-containing protein [Leptospirales bacterium]